MLDELSQAAPGWLREHAGAEWVERYGRRSDEYRLPKTKEAKQVLADQMGQNGAKLLGAIYSPDSLQLLREVPAVEMMRRIWLQNYLQTGEGVRFRTEEDGIPKAARFISSPHDQDAHLGRKGSNSWMGYKVSLTETCEDDAPSLITHVETIGAPTADGEVTPNIHEDLQSKGLLPEVHLVDTGFLDSELIVDSRQEYGVELLGPTRRDRRWKLRAAEGFGMENFTVDFERCKAICPDGHESIEWGPRVDNRGNDTIHIRFSPSDCRPCPSRVECTYSKAKYPRRTITIRPKGQYEALLERREYETSREYSREYARRAGVEATMSQGVRRCGVRRSRYIGLARTHLGHVLTAAALNFVRVADWLSGKPRAQTRRSPFATLMTQPL